MFSGIKNFFSKLFAGNSSNTLSYAKLFDKLRYWKSNRVYPIYSNLPDAITFPESFWKRAIELYKETRLDGFERAVSVFWVDGDIILTSTVQGNTKQVTSSGKVSVRYVPNPNRKEYYKKEIYVDEKLYSREDIYIKKIPKEIKVEYLFNMHTHPKHIGDSFEHIAPDRVGGLELSYSAGLAEGKTTPKQIFYSFFSLQDVRALLSGGAAISGLITDKLWIIMRSAQTPVTVGDFEERDLSVNSLEDEFKIGVYCGDFREKVVRSK